MPELLQEYWLLVLVALLIGVAVAWWIFHASRKTTVQREDRVEETGSARRNQALIDSPPAATKDDEVAVDKRAAEELVDDNEEAQAAASAASPGPVSAAANMDEVAAAPANADAEAGAGVPAREAIRAMNTDTPARATQTNGDDLTRMKGVGPKLAANLREQGITSFAQIAAWTDADIDRVDAQLGRFEGRIRRDDWVEQARFLSADDIAGYEAQFGKV
ncbi:MAG: helix-hairpin-helix domain-containing protein [Alteraurantiacibacter sp.]